MVVATQNRKIREDARAFKKDMILKVALEMFYERGFAGTTVEALSERLSVTKPFIYSYFENKNAILVELYEIVAARIVDLLDQALATAGSPREQLASFIAAFARENMESRMIATVFMQEEKQLEEQFLQRIRLRQGAFDQRLANLIRRGVEAGEFRVEDPAIAAFAITGMVRWIQRWYKPEGRYGVEELSRMMSDMALGAVGAQPR
jgi:AcrR family transcriptional regulator